MEIETQYPITLLTKIARVSRSAYYRYKNKPKPITTKTEKLVIDIYRKSGKRKGYRSITDTMRNKYHLIVKKKKVLRIMQENNIQSVISKKCKPKVENATYKENILKRDFESDTPYKKLVTDITYIPTRRQMVYLCIIQDLYNNEPLAWTVRDQQDKSLSVDTIKQLSRKYSLRGALIHSDQGVHYTNKEYVTLLEKLSVTQSMSRKGNCWDNACAESFFGHFKNETIHLMKQKPENLKEVIDMVEDYMVYYINERPQRKLGGLTPSLYKKQSNTV
jgi:transposase InsO family protein